MSEATIPDDVVERVKLAIYPVLVTYGPDYAARVARAALEAARYGELVELLKKLDVALTCRRDDDAHYCPNCDNSLFNERESIRALLSTIGYPTDIGASQS